MMKEEQILAVYHQRSDVVVQLVKTLLQQIQQLKARIEQRKHAWKKTVLTAICRLFGIVFVPATPWKKIGN